MRVDDDAESVLDLGDRDATDWERFSHGSLPGSGDRSPSPSVFDVLAAVIACAAALLLLAAIAQAFDFFGASVRVRVFVVAVDGGSALNAALALGAVIVTVLGGEQGSPLRRWTMACAVSVSGFVLMSALYSIAYAAFAHPHIDNNFSIAEVRAAQAAADWSIRIETMLVALAAGLLAAGAVYVARRAGATRAPQSISSDRPVTP